MTKGFMAVKGTEPVLLKLKSTLYVSEIPVVKAMFPVKDEKLSLGFSIVRVALPEPVRTPKDEQRPFGAVGQATLVTISSVTISIVLRPEVTKLLALISILNCNAFPAAIPEGML
jgi:hypothetical protein